LDHDITEFKHLSDADLIELIRNCLARTVADFIVLAKGVHEAGRRGIDLSEVQLPVVHLLRKIACGQLLPDAMVKLGGTMVLGRVASLPLPDQQRVIDLVDRGQGINVARFENGEIQSVRIPVAHLSRKQISQVFARDHIRDDVEQVSWLRNKQDNTQKPQIIEGPRVDRKRGKLMIPAHTELMAISKTELLRYLMQMEG